LSQAQNTNHRHPSSLSSSILKKPPPSSPPRDSSSSTSSLFAFLVDSVYSLSPLSPFLLRPPNNNHRAPLLPLLPPSQKTSSLLLLPAKRLVLVHLFLSLLPHQLRPLACRLFCSAPPSPPSLPSPLARRRPPSLPSSLPRDKRHYIASSLLLSLLPRLHADNICSLSPLSSLSSLSSPLFLLCLINTGTMGQRTKFFF